VSRKRRQEHEEPESSERWLLTYADLITLLLGLFVILYAMSKVDQAKFNEVAIALNQTFGGKTILSEHSGITPMPAPPPQNSADNNDEVSSDSEQNEVSQNINKALEEYVQSSKVSIAESSEELTIHLLETLIFETGSDTIKPEARNVLNKLSDLIRVLPNKIRVEGHTDNIPINTPQFPSNWHLSIARSLNTAYYMMQKGVNPKKISILGYSEYKPIGPNDTPENRAKNRRVDIVIIKPNNNYSATLTEKLMGQ
jgi:chemotaxis protein MotB